MRGGDDGVATPQSCHEGIEEGEANVGAVIFGRRTYENSHAWGGNEDPLGNLHIPRRRFIWLVGRYHDAGGRHFGVEKPESGE